MESLDRITFSQELDEAECERAAQELARLALEEATAIRAQLPRLYEQAHDLNGEVR